MKPLPGIIRGLERRGFELVTVSTILGGQMILAGRKADGSDRSPGGP
jgi:hypothetical protein